VTERDIDRSELDVAAELRTELRADLVPDHVRADVRIDHAECERDEQQRPDADGTRDERAAPEPG
jgi:hypothetical protein